jgi:hypothetical protein
LNVPFGQKTIEREVADRIFGIRFLLFTLSIRKIKGWMSLEYCCFKFFSFLRLLVTKKYRKAEN